jgi:hypothetical protein
MMLAKNTLDSTVANRGCGGIAARERLMTMVQKSKPEDKIEMVSGSSNLPQNHIKVFASPTSALTPMRATKSLKNGTAFATTYDDTVKSKVKTSHRRLGCRSRAKRATRWKNILSIEEQMACEFIASSHIRHGNRKFELEDFAGSSHGRHCHLHDTATWIQRSNPATLRLGPEAIASNKKDGGSVVQR